MSLQTFFTTVDVSSSINSRIFRDHLTCQSHLSVPNVSTTYPADGCQSLFPDFPSYDATLVQYYLASVADAKTPPNITTDRDALLALKARISYDPYSILANNWCTNVYVCNWVGVTCNFHHHRVTVLDLSFMGLVGTIPPHVGNLSFLVVLALRNNSFHGSIPIELAHLKRLKIFHFLFNNLDGELPLWMGLLSKLQYLNLEYNHFTGTIPSAMSNMSSLRVLALTSNNLVGSIPSFFFNLPRLQRIYLGGNKLSGPILAISYNMPSLQEIDLFSNQLSGRLPTNMFDHLPNLQSLGMAYNQLDGGLPSSLFKCKQLQYLDLNSNKLTGRVPKEIGNLTALTDLYLDFNNFEGRLPPEIGNLGMLMVMILSNNSFEGRVPLEIGNLTMLTMLYLSTITLKLMEPYIPLGDRLVIKFSNRLSFSKVGNMKVLTQLDLSKNQLSGDIPMTIGGLKDLTDLSLADNRLEGAIPESFGELFGQDATKEMPKVLLVDAELSPLAQWRRISQQELIQATDGFSLNNLLGEGSFGSVYKGTLSDGMNIATKRLNIVIDVASALEYLHHGYSTSIVHCDLKPSNVLLDEDMVAHLADFGIAKLLGDGDSMTWTMTLATTGYMAPEYGSQGIVSSKGDMYSFGILLMETFTRRRPTDDMFIGEMSLKDWVDGSLPHAIIDIMDPNLLRNEREDDAVKECISSLMGLAMGCCAESPEQRTNIVKVSATLNKIKLKLVKDIGRS
ncbi:LRR receptor-like serine/threonine-protein kinase GSO1 [Morella rubra]|uniref:non-specific serine/threonine protein kinase n=1 Tax=Morella rubra TaxID=262757 RepID=A0A6A1WDM0_9ROSI|nr:LRR receptor-like serine/threonine-protein kinase GSO1 [Morella rubra]